MHDLEGRVNIQPFLTKGHCSRIWEERYRSVNKFPFVLDLPIPHIVLLNSQFC